MKTLPVIGTPLAVTDYTGAVAQALRWAEAGDAPRCIAAANTHLVTLARCDRKFGAAMARFDLILPDGMPLVWVLNRELRCAGEPALGDRVYGPTFMLRCLEAAQGDAHRHFFLGGTDELLGALQTKLRARFPTLEIAGDYAPPFGDWPAEETARITERIRDSRADFVWVGLGCPKQELWLAENKSRLPAGVYAGVGAAFAFHAGAVRQAPMWMQRAGLEWAFRIAAEPRRLLSRYVAFNSLFLFHLAAERLRRRTVADDLRGKPK